MYGSRPPLSPHTNIGFRSRNPKGVSTIILLSLLLLLLYIYRKRHQHSDVEGDSAEDGGNKAGGQYKLWSRKLSENEPSDCKVSSMGLAPGHAGVIFGTSTAL